MYTVKAAMQMNVSMLLMSYSYCPLPVLMWLVDKGLGRLAHKMPHCKNTVNQDLSLSVFKGEQVSLVKDVNGKFPSLQGTESGSLWGNLLFSAGPVEKTVGEVQQAPKQRKPPWFMCAAGPEDGKPPA